MLIYVQKHVHIYLQNRTCIYHTKTNSTIEGDIKIVMEIRPVKKCIMMQHQIRLQYSKDKQQQVILKKATMHNICLHHYN